MNLEQKQQQFEYRSPKDLHVHGEPFSPEKWNATLLRIAGRCPAGDARLRLVWGGTAKKRAYVQTATNSVPVMSIKYPGPVPKIRELKGFSYFNDHGKTVNVAKHDQVPANKIAIPNYDYYELGMLRWVLERKFTPQELIAMGHYPDPDSPEGKNHGMRGGRRFMPQMDAKGEYIGLYPLETPDGKYFEPDDLWFTILHNTQRETEAMTPGKRESLFTEYMEKLDEADRQLAAQKEELKEIIIDEAIVEAENAPQGQVAFYQGNNK